ncbi:WecB/TagA/CpsF family glycosyltransferase [Edaphobacter flagellatus]|uniref:WecB/TagA/CpsF family glycosyltransferase n=1 Tax=Edaphobacter flagellatus TaxID=1933044 RepID=UPI0021B198C9|nr:WecB/TagA/CpsF family glycosyltransferase [Edaphobacter flagellatus]
MPAKKQELDSQQGYVSDTPSRSHLLANLDDKFSKDGIRQRKRALFRHSLAWTLSIWAAEVLRRLIEATLAAFLIAILSPFLLALLLLARLSGGGLREQTRLGRWATHFQQYEIHFPPSSFLSRLGFLRSLPALVNVFRGEMSFIGPRAASPAETFSGERMAWKRYNLRPGLLSLWWLRKRANIAYSTEVGLDLEYIETNSLWGDLGIAARAIPTAFFGGGASDAPPKLSFLGVNIDNLTMAEASARIISMAQSGVPSQVSFVNADCVNIAFNDSQYKQTLASSQLVLADGIGVRIAGAILNQHVRENINGTDMLPFLCDAAEQAGLSLYLLGGRPGIPEAAADWITQRYPDLRIAGCRHGYFSPEEEPSIFEAIKDSRADILLVAFGAPRQEKWIASHKTQLAAKVSIGVGGLLDFYSGRIPRAPVWIRELGMEWFYRFWQEPRRMWRRYFLGNAVFLYRLAEERLHARPSSPRAGGLTT